MRKIAIRYTMAKYDVFISYSRKDFDEVENFVSRLNECIPALSCWLDVADYDKLDEGVTTIIDDSLCLLFMQSENSARDTWPEKETLYAKNIGKKVVPILLPGAKKRGWYMFKFGGLDFVDSTNKTAFDAFVDALSALTNKSVERAVEQPTFIEMVDKPASVTDAVDEPVNEPELNEVAEENFESPFVFSLDSGGEFAPSFKVLPSSFQSDTDDTPLPDAVTSETDESGESPVVSADVPFAEEFTPVTPPPTAIYQSQKKNPSVNFTLVKLLTVVVIALLFYIFKDPEISVGEKFSNGFSAMKVDEKWGFVNEYDSLVVQFKYDDVKDLGKGYTAVCADGKWGYMNLLGKEITPLKYDEVWRFSDGCACVRIKDKMGLIDIGGREITPIKYEYISWISSAIAASKGSRKTFPLQVRAKGKWGFVDQKGKEIVPLKYEHTRQSFKEGLVAVRMNGKWGFVDMNGEEVVKPIYDNVEDFYEGRALVLLNGDYLYIDKNGKNVE